MPDPAGAALIFALFVGCLLKLHELANLFAASF